MIVLCVFTIARVYEIGAVLNHNSCEHCWEKKHDYGVMHHCTQVRLYFIQSFFFASASFSTCSSQHNRGTIAEALDADINWARWHTTECGAIVVFDHMLVMLFSQWCSPYGLILSLPLVTLDNSMQIVMCMSMVKA